MFRHQFLFKHFYTMRFLLILLYISYTYSFLPPFSAKMRISKLWSSSFGKHPIHSSPPLSATLQSSDLQTTSDVVPPLNQEPPLKILLIVEPTPFNYISGYANRFKEMLDHLHLAGDYVHIITTDGSSSPPTTYRNYNITTLLGIPLPMYKAVRISLDVRGRIFEFIRKLQPDLIHVSSPSFIVYPAILWSKVFKIPLVMSYHTHIIEYFKTYIKVPGSVNFAKWLLRSTHNSADMTLCTSPQLKQDMEELGIKNLDVWMKGINTKIFNPAYRNQEMRSKLSQGNPDAPLLLYVGRLGDEKKLIRLRKVLDALPQVRLAFVGHGPAESALKEYFKGYPVAFMGSLSGIFLSQAFASADVFVMPSDTETLGFVVLEAMASGLPVVAVNAGGLPDIVEDGLNGALVRNDDSVVEFIASTKLLVEDVNKRRTIGQQAREWAERWSWEAATSQLRNVHYRKAIVNNINSNRPAAVRNEIIKPTEYATYYRPDLAL